MRTVAVIGAGRMGEALLSGLLRAGWAKQSLLATDKRPERAAELDAAYGIRFVDNDTAAATAQVLVIAVKPQEVVALLESLEGKITPSTLVVTLCAGLPTTLFARHLPDATPVVRVMPNTPAFVAQAMTAISPGTHATEEHLTVVETMFRSFGRTVRVPEQQQDAVTALSGSGPAYFFYVVEAMIEAGVLLGLPRPVAHELIVQTALGSATMLRDSGEHPTLLREAVTSPAGTTAAALRVLDDRGVRAAMLAALEAARDRAGELGGG